MASVTEESQQHKISFAAVVATVATWQHLKDVWEAVLQGPVLMQGL